MMGVGYTCGRISIFAVPQMLVIKLIGRPGKAQEAFPVAVISLLFVHNNEGLVAQYADGSIYLIELNRAASDPCFKLIKAPSSSQCDKKTEASVLCSTFGQDQYFGVLSPRTSQFEIHRVSSSLTTRIAGSAKKVPSIELSCVRLWVGIIKNSLALSKFERGKRIHEMGVQLKDAYIVPSEEGFFVSVICIQLTGHTSRAPGPFVASFLAARRKSYEVEVLTQEVLLTSVFSLPSMVTHTFAHDICVLVTHTDILVFSVGREIFASKMTAVVMASLPSSLCTVDGGLDFSNSAITASKVEIEIDTTEMGGKTTIEVCMLCHARPALLKFRLAVTEGKLKYDFDELEELEDQEQSSSD